MINRLILFSIAIIFSSCDPDTERKTTCYSFINETDKEIVMEMYSYNSGQFVSNVGFYRASSLDTIVSKCVLKADVPGPTFVYKFDSIVVRFNNNRKLVYLKRFLQNPDPIFDGNNYTKEPGTLNFYWNFTQQDYDNAEPF